MQATAGTVSFVKQVCAIINENNLKSSTFLP